MRQREETASDYETRVGACSADVPLPADPRDGRSRREGASASRQSARSGRSKSLTHAASRTLRRAYRAFGDHTRALIDESPFGILVHRNCDLLFVNEALATLFGYDSAEEMMEIGSLYRHLPPSEARRLQIYERSRLEGGGGPSDYEFEAIRKDGSRLNLLVHPRLIEWEGRPATFSYLLDITQRTRLEETLRLAHVISGKLSQSVSVDDAVRMVLREICEHSEWVLGESWVPARRGGWLERGPSWHIASQALESFDRESRGTRCARKEDLPGRVWATRRCEWIADVSRVSTARFRRADLASRAGLKAACAIPVVSHNRVLVVFAFYMTGYREHERARLDALLASVASLGPFIQRIHAEEALRRHEQIVGASPDYVGFVDRGYCYRAVSGRHALELQRRRDDIVGMSIPALYGADTFERLLKPHLDRSLAGDNVRFQAWIPLPSSGRRYMDISYAPYREVSGEVSGCVAILRDITDLHRAERELRESGVRLRNLAARLAESREEERREIAREIHDELGQKLTALKMDLEQWLDAPGRGERPAAISALIRLADELIIDVQRLAGTLRPAMLDELGLADAIVFLAEDYAQRMGWECELAVGEVPAVRGRDIALYRIAQEALTNIARHAQATRVKLHLTLSRGRLVMAIEDDGRGIGRRELTDSGSIGLIGMRERALALGGKLSVRRRRAGGTTVRLALPVARDTGSCDGP